jgi:tetratricopeptide (TPR) repeat protein
VLHLIRIVVAGFCAYAIWWSNRFAVADLAASAGTEQGFEKAMRIAPEDAELRLKVALHRADNDDSVSSPAVDDDLRAAAKLNPLNSDLLMSIGLREEFRGDKAAAERDFKRAVEVDRQFKPAWTLANFYYRTNEPEKSRPLLKQVLQLEPLGFDPNPVFDLFWAEEGEGDETAASRKVMDSIPAHGERRIQYLTYLVRTKRAEAVLDAWPKALEAANLKNADQVSTLTDVADFLVKQGNMAGAVKVWNDLVDRGVGKGERLNPEKGASVADPEFQFPMDGRGFAWGQGQIPGVFISKIASGLRFEIDGNEPEGFVLLGVTAPVIPGRQYHLTWKADGTALNSPHDPGFLFEIAEKPGEKGSAVCGGLLASGNAHCDFMTQADSVQVRLRYGRAQGTVRANGVLQLDSVRLEPAK